MLSLFSHDIHMPNLGALTGGGKTMATSLFEKYGGFATVSKIVLDLYDRLLDDEQVGPFFDNVDMARIVDHQTKFVSSLMGGPASYTDDQIQKMHARLDIAHADFDRVAEILTDTLKAHGVADEDIAAIVGSFSGRRNLVVE